MSETPHTDAAEIASEATDATIAEATSEAQSQAAAVDAAVAADAATTAASVAVEATDAAVSAEETAEVATAVAGEAAEVATEAAEVAVSDRQRIDGIYDRLEQLHSIIESRLPENPPEPPVTEVHVGTDTNSGTETASSETDPGTAPEEREHRSRRTREGTQSSGGRRQRRR